MNVLTKMPQLLISFLFLTLAACGPVEPEMKPYDIVAQQFLQSLSDGDIKRAEALASDTNGAKKAVPLIHQTMLTMLSNSKKERIEFKWVSSSQKNDKASVVFAQILDGESTMTNIRIILIKESALDDGWRVIDLGST